MDPNNDTEKQYDELTAKIHEAVFAKDDEALDALLKTEEEKKSEVEVKPDEPVTPKPETPQSTDEPVKETKAEEQPQTPDEDDVAKLKEELARLKEIEHRYKSDMGRTPSLQRKISQYEKELEELRQKAASPETKQTNSKISDRLAQLREVDPAMADLFEEAFGELRKEVERKEAATKSMFEEREIQETLSKEAEKLVSYHPRAFDVFDMPEWQNWKARQTPGVLALAESMYADDVIKAFELFGRDMNLLNPQPASQSAPAAKAPEQSAPAVVVDEKAKKAEEERKRKLEAPTSGAKPMSPEGDGLPTDPDKLLDHYYKQALKEMGLLKTK